MFLVHFRGPAGPRRPPAPYGNYGPRGNYDPPTSIQAFTVGAATAAGTFLELFANGPIRLTIFQKLIGDRSENLPKTKQNKILGWFQRRARALKKGL